jgi:ABC-type lipoprotein export system ATPase subunit
MVTHDSRFAQYAQRTVHLFDGQIVAEDEENARDIPQERIANTEYGIQER